MWERDLGGWFKGEDAIMIVGAALGLVLIVMDGIIVSDDDGEELK